MDSLLPVAQAPILKMSGGAITSLLPVGSGPIISMSGGEQLHNIPKGFAESTISSATFGVVKIDSQNEPLVTEKVICDSITETSRPVCDYLQPFVDRRVEALLKRVRFPSGNANIDIGCGSIMRKGTTLTIKFHEKAITLLSSDLTGTFAKFHTDISFRSSGSHNTYPPNSTKMHDLLQWMLGSSVNENGPFDLITFMDQMKTQANVLFLSGFRQFLNYHKENVNDMDVLRYAMELYGYKTGAVVNEKNVYGLILSPNTAVRRVDDKYSFYAIYENGTVTSGEVWNYKWPSQVGGFAVFTPAPVVANTSASASATTTADGLLATSPFLNTAPTAPTAPSSAISYNKINDTVTVPDHQTINDTQYSLQGAIYHDGNTITSGHYTYLYHSLTYPTSSDNWVEFNDTTVTPGTRPTSINKGYVYLFKRDGLAGGSHKGIINHGNSCWMNAALQMFYHIPEYRAYVEGFSADTSALSQEIKDITLAIQKIFLKYSGTDQVIKCSAEYQTLFKYTFPDQSIGSQQDAMEFITKVLLGIIDTVPDVKDLFVIEYTSTLTCSDNTMLSSTNTFQTNVLSLAIPSRTNDLTLDALLKKEGEPEIMSDGMRIDGKWCQIFTKTVKITIPSANKYVIIQLMRFI